MKLPNLKQAVVPKKKIMEYLLSETHEDGKNKAAFFVQFGFSQENWEALADALSNHAKEHEVAKTVVTPYGTNYVIKGTLNAPDGRQPFVRSVWVIENDSTIPRLVTAYPL